MATAAVVCELTWATQLRARDFSFSVPAPFSPADILAVQPVVKNSLFGVRCPLSRHVSLV
jgi:hypothetical protein